MELSFLLLITLALGLVAFINAFWGGIYRCLCLSESLLVSLVFVVLLTAMFWIGILLGHRFANALGWMAIPIAEAILMLLGIKLMYYGIRNRPEQKSFNLARFGELLAVSFASSLNAFIAGMGYGMLRPIPVLIFYLIGFSVAAFSLLGVTLGKKQGKFIYARIASLLSGASMIILAVLLGIELYLMKGSL